MSNDSPARRHDLGALRVFACCLDLPRARGSESASRGSAPKEFQVHGCPAIRVLGRTNTRFRVGLEYQCREHV